MPSKKARPTSLPSAIAADCLRAAGARASIIPTKFKSITTRVLEHFNYKMREIPESGRNLYCTNTDCRRLVHQTAHKILR